MILWIFKTILQNVVVLSYIVSGKIVERFWSFDKLTQGDAETISTHVLHCLCDVLPTIEDKQKLVAQSYDGAVVMCGSRRSVQNIAMKSIAMHTNSTLLSTKLHPNFQVLGYSLPT